jgi:ribulose bisphosphate carboxylase small subunit
MMSVLDQSYQFARSFNEDKDLRTGLWKVGENRATFNTLKVRRLIPSYRIHETPPQFAEAGIQ